MLIVRQAEIEDAPGIARVHVESWRSAYAGIIPQDYIDGLNVRDRTLRWARTLDRSSENLTLVSESNDGRIVGFACGGTLRHREPRFQAEISALYIAPEIQRQGHGTRLFMALSDRLAARGLAGLFIWVLADNQPGRRFYEKAGGEAVSEIERDFSGKPLREIGYGWRETPRYG